MDLHVNRARPVSYGDNHGKNPYSRGDDIKQSIMREQQGQGAVAHFHHKQAANLEEKTLVNHLEGSHTLEHLHQAKDYKPGALFLAKA